MHLRNGSAIDLHFQHLPRSEVIVDDALDQFDVGSHGIGCADLGDAAKAASELAVYKSGGRDRNPATSDFH